ncbi:NUDIX hydrolase [bacterium]|nr:NUDIX hydrolase [bacterium]
MRTIGTEELYRGKFSAIREQIENSTGKHFWVETIQHPGGVVILPITESGEIVCVAQYRHAVGQELLELPAGTLLADELPTNCANRELSEETGFAARRLTYLGTQLPAPEFCNEVQFCFLAEGLYPKAAPADDDEDIRVITLTVEEFDARVRSGLIVDCKSIALFYRALFFNGAMVKEGKTVILRSDSVFTR